MTTVRIVVSLLYSLVGLSGFLAFVILKNYPAAILAVGTGIINAVLTHLHILRRRDRLQEWYTPQNVWNIGRFGFFIFTIGTMCLVYFSVVEIMLKTPILPVSTSVVIPIVWSLIILKSGLIVLYYASSYSRTNEGFLAQEVTESYDERSRGPQEITAQTA